MTDGQGRADSEEGSPGDADWRRRWYEEADAQAREKGFESYEDFVAEEARKRAARLAEPMPPDWREDTKP